MELICTFNGAYARGPMELVYQKYISGNR